MRPSRHHTNTAVALCVLLGIPLPTITQATVPSPSGTASRFTEIANMDVTNGRLDSCVVFRDADGDIAIDSEGNELVFRVYFEANGAITDFAVTDYEQLTTAAIDAMRDPADPALLLQCSGEYRNGIYSDLVYLDAPGADYDGQVYSAILNLNNTAGGVFVIDTASATIVRSYSGNSTALGENLGAFSEDSSVELSSAESTQISLPECQDPEGDPVHVDLIAGTRILDENLLPGSNYTIAYDAIDDGMQQITARCEDSPQFDVNYSARVTAPGNLLVIALANPEVFDPEIGITLTGTAGDDVLNGSAGDDALYGVGGNDTLNGLAGNDVLNGGPGNDTLNGGPGADTMNGKAGDDTYEVEDGGDTVVEDSGKGTDLIQSALSYTLPANVEHLTLTGSGNLSGTGNAEDNTLTGNSGNNTLDGGTGADSLVGGAGNDTYLVDNAGDTVTENAAEGTDLVQSSVTFTLPANTENLTLVGSGNIDATGNAEDNTLTGNSGDNAISGLGGADSIDAADGNDSIVADDNDTSIDGGNGTDTLRVLADFTANTANQIENIEIVNLEAGGLTLSMGSFIDIDATINGFSGGSNTIVGSDGDETVIGGNAADNLDGGDGTDTITGGAGADTISVGAGTGNVVRYTAVDQGGAVGGGGVFSAGDTVNSFVVAGAVSSVDIFDFVGITNIQNVVAGFASFESVASGAPTGTNTVIYINNATAASLTDTANVLASIGNFSGNAAGFATGDVHIFVVGNTGGTAFGLYAYTESDGNATVIEGDLRLLAIVSTAVTGFDADNIK